jgi:hypothetical protein
MVGIEGIEPTCSCEHRILSPARLPVPPYAPFSVYYYNKHYSIIKTYFGQYLKISLFLFTLDKIAEIC